MHYCEYCGEPLTTPDSKCKSCGAPVPRGVLEDLMLTNVNQSTVLPGTVYSSNDTITTGKSRYRVVLASLGTCSSSKAIGTLKGLLNYDDTQAAKLIVNIPVEVAKNLTLEQATYLTQVFSETGMEAAVYDGSEFTDISGYATQSVYNNSGDLWSSVLASMAALTIANQVTSYSQWNKPGYSSYIFKPAYQSPKPPVYSHGSNYNYNYNYGYGSSYNPKPSYSYGFGFGAPQPHHPTHHTTLHTVYNPKPSQQVYNPPKPSNKPSNKPKPGSGTDHGLLGNWILGGGPSSGSNKPGSKPKPGGKR